VLASNGLSLILLKNFSTLFVLAMSFKLTCKYLTSSHYQDTSKVEISGQLITNFKTIF
jgi:hypothetical protein